MYISTNPVPPPLQQFVCSRSRNCHFLHGRENYNRQHDTLQATPSLNSAFASIETNCKILETNFSPTPLTCMTTTVENSKCRFYHRSKWPFNDGFACVPEAYFVEICFSPHWAWYKSNRENSELNFIAYRFQPHPPSAYKVQRSWVFEVLARSLQQTYLNCGLACVPAACLAEVYFSVVQILNSNGLNGKNLTVSFTLDVTT